MCVCESVSPPTGGAHMCGGEATECVPAAALTVRRHGADNGLEVFLLLQTGGVRLGGDCTERETHDKPS